MAGLLKGNISAKGQGLDGNPQNINRKGRPRKSVGYVLKELERANVKPITKSQIETIYLSLLNIELAFLKKLAEDKDTVILIKIVAKAIISGRGLDIIEKMLDRAIGKSVTTINQNSKIELPKNPLGDKLKELGLD